MSDQITGEVDAPPEQVFDQNESGQTEDKPPVEKSSGGGIGGVLAIVLSLLAIGIASYPAYEIYQQKQMASDTQVDPLVSELTRVETRVGALGDDLQRVNTSLDELGTQLATGNDEIRSLQASVSDELQSMRSRMGTSSQDWVYAEVEYLVRMANQRVLMEQDATSALQLLQSADEIIRDTDGLTAHGLRRALAGDIAALKAVQTPDTQGVYLELSAMISQVATLQRSLPAYQAPVQEPAGGTEITGLLDRVMGAVKRAAARLSGLVDFRRGGVEIKPILPPEEEYFLRQNLVLKLQIAQMALLEGNSRVFKVALGEARQWVSDSFDEEGSGTVAMLEVLGRLSLVEVAVELPDISGSLKAARTHVAGTGDTGNGEAQTK